MLRQAIRPHGKEVTAVHQSPNRKLLASASADETVFFFDNSEQLAPIGFVKLNSAVVDFQWINDTKLLAWCRGGLAFQISLPNMTNVDTSESFEIVGAFVKAYKFQSCKGKLARARAKEKFDLEVSKLRAKCDARLKEMKKKAKDLGEQVSDDEVKNLYAPVNEMQFEEKDEYHFVPNKLGDMTWAKSVDGEEDHMYFQMSGYDSGLIYKTKLSPLTEDMAASDPVDAWILDTDEEVCSWLERDRRIYAGYSFVF